MSKEKAIAPSTMGMFLQELGQFGLYKRTQGRMSRQLTCLAIWVTFALAAWSTYASITWGFVDRWLPNSAIPVAMMLRYTVPTLLLFGGVWLGYRLVNYAPFADFLIAVEAEMNKVTWPSRTEMVRSAVVVIIIMFGLALVIFVYDNVLRFVLQLLNIVD